MDLVNEKVIFKNGDIGEIVQNDDKYVHINLNGEVKKYSIKFCMEKNIFTFENILIQTIINQDVETASSKESQKSNEFLVKLELGNYTKSGIKRLSNLDYNIQFLNIAHEIKWWKLKNEFEYVVYGQFRSISITDTSIVLVSHLEWKYGKYQYVDKWDVNGDYLFVGEGKTGDQKLTKKNQTLIDAINKKTKIILFVCLDRMDCYLQGEFKVVDYENVDIIDNNVKRKVYRYRLRKEKEMTNNDLDIEIEKLKELNNYGDDFFLE